MVFKKIVGFMLIISERQSLSQKDKDLICSVTNIITVAITAIQYLQEEQERIKLQQIKSKYII